MTDSEAAALPPRPGYRLNVPVGTPCPLCGGKRHRKDKRASQRECAWRQWAIETGATKPDDPLSLIPDETPQTRAAFYAWQEAHPDLEAGSVPAEKIFRQRHRLASVSGA
jgi:hypothetical protein